jgi:C4-dicarboxylate transporter DctQ subunit
MEWWHRVDRLLAAVEQAVAVVMLLGLLGLGLLQVLLRNLFAGGLFWADGVLRHMVLWLGFLGASLATREQRHLSIDALPRMLPDRARAWTALLTNLTAVVVCALLTKAAWRFVQFEGMAGTTLAVGLATWVAQAIMPWGLLIMTLRFAWRTLETLVQLVQRLPNP